jgi:hypothetical protein
MNNITNLSHKVFILAIFPVLSILFIAHDQEVSAASAIAYDAQRSVYAYRYNAGNRREAENLAINGCQRRGGTNCRIIVSCAQGGYGMIFMRRLPGQRIQALGASCGASQWQTANNNARIACNNVGNGRCAGPKVSWFDTVGTRTSSNRPFNRGTINNRRSTPRNTVSAQPIRWDTTLVNTRLFYNAQVPGTRFTLYCPPRGYLMNAYGTNTYHINSSVCTAAVHRGVITTSGGVVRIQIRRTSATLQGSTRNGVRTHNSQIRDPRWRLGFVFTR